MKTLRLPILQRLREFFSLIPGALGRQAEEDGLSWNLLLSGINARVLVAWKKTAHNTYRIFFRHSFPGHARIELLVCHRMADGTVRMLKKVFGSGSSKSILNDSRNILRANEGCSISIVSMSIRYSSCGIPHTLHIDAADGTQQLLKKGKQSAHGPHFSLALHSLPLLQFFSAPITPPTTGNQELFKLALANC